MSTSTTLQSEAPLNSTPNTHQLNLDSDVTQNQLPKIRHEWYQTQALVVVSILVKGVNKDGVHVDIDETSLSVTVKQGAADDYRLNVTLSQEVVPDQCQTRILSSKIEIKLKKKYGYNWSKLERDVTQPTTTRLSMPDTSDSLATKMYPSSNKNPRDWDKIVHDIKEQEKTEEPEGDEALNKLFQKIYADGSDETRKAMNKSFSESGGTVLSTNWGEIGDKKTEVKPPDGMEFRKWDV